MILGDKKSNGPQFSKLIVIVVGIICLLGVVATAMASLWLGMTETVAIALIGAFGSIVATTLIWFLKKSQVENNTKIYMEAYKDIAMFKINHGEDASDLLQNVENNMIDKMDNNINEAINEGASLIEQVEVSR